MQRHFLAAFVCGALLFAPYAGASRANISFTVQNKTHATLTALYGGPSSTDDWGDNVLDHKVPPGGSVTVTIGRADTCEYDFRYEFSDQEPYEEYEIDICSIDGEEFEIN